MQMQTFKRIYRNFQRRLIALAAIGAAAFALPTCTDVRDVACSCDEVTELQDLVGDLEQLIDDQVDD